MKREENATSFIYCNSDRPDASIPRRRSDNTDLNDDEEESQEMIKENSDDQREHDGKQNDHTKDTEEVNYFNAHTMAQSEFLFI
jgi:hypothetical protein